MPASILGEVDKLFRASGVDLTGLGLAWARALPVVTLVPAFGLRALPPSARAVLGLVLGLVIAPAASPSPLEPQLMFPVALLIEVLRGLPIALSAALPLWAATQAGGLIDNLRGASGEANYPLLEGRVSPLGVMYGVLAGSLFLAQGGPAHVTQLLMTSTYAPGLLLTVVQQVTRGVDLSVAIAAPMLGGSVLVEVATALMGRAANPTQLSAVIAPIKSVVLLGLVALTLERVTAFLAVVTAVSVH
jgi:flagellar biosynthesis protein FliR